MRAALLATLMLVAPVAHAHAILMDSQPSLRGAVPPGAVAITLRYNSRIDAVRSRLMLIRADHSRTDLPLAPADPAEDRLQSRADLAPGEYVLRWQVLAVDGHITRGDVPFTVAPPAQASNGSPAP